MPHPIRKAVFPAAGLGTRFLPATKAVPKEMLVLVDKPIIQYGVEEAVASGIADVVLVTNPGRSIIEDHFAAAPELEAVLEHRGKTAELNLIRAITSLARVSVVHQREALGLGHAVLAAKEFVGDEPFAVVLSDDVIHAVTPALRQLIDVYERVDAPVIAVERVPTDKVSSYGIVAVEDASEFGAGVYRIMDLVEKPAPPDAPSDLAIVGRYVLTPDVFPELEGTANDGTGEIQLTNGLRRLLATRPLYAREVSGVRHDTGNRLGLLKAQLYFALQLPELARPLREYFEGLS